MLPVPLPIIINIQVNVHQALTGLFEIYNENEDIITTSKYFDWLL